MALNVKFLKGTASQYEASSKLSTTFYLVDDTDLYLGSTKLSNGADLAAAITRIAKNENDITSIKNQLTTLTAESGEGSIAKMIADAIAPINTEIGTATLETTDKTLKGAINELKSSIESSGTAAEITVSEKTSSDYAKVYEIAQGGSVKGTINIPKDMVVKSGEVVINPEGQPAGTYMVITLANTNEDKIYINVGTLVDIYTAQAEAAQVQLSINDREISASIVAGSISSTEIAANAIITSKVADGNITKVKLSTEVQASLDKADAAVAKTTYDAKMATLDESIASLGGRTDVLEGKVDVAKVSTAIETAKSQAIATAAQDATDKVDSAKEALQADINLKATEADLTAAEERITALETAIGEGGSVESQIDAKIQTLDSTVSSTEPTAGQGIKVTVSEVDGKLTSVTVAGNYDSKYDAAGSAATAQSNAAADATTKANQAETNAKAYVDSALTWGTIA